MSEQTGELLEPELSASAKEFAMKNVEFYRDRLATCPRSYLETLAMVLIQKRSVDGLNGRRWDASAHLFFEDGVAAILRGMVVERSEMGNGR